MLEYVSPLGQVPNLVLQGGKRAMARFLPIGGQMKISRI